ncbi:hypothetical protein AB9F42_34790, partial [Rhizobium leguminosarum]
MPEQNDGRVADGNRAAACDDNEQALQEGRHGHLRYLLELAAVIGIAAAGKTLVILMGGIDLSVGAVITVTAILLPLISPAWDP